MTPTARLDHLDTRDLRSERLCPACSLTWPAGELRRFEWHEHKAMCV